MAAKTTRPYGAWPSPITAELIASASVGLGQIALDGEDVYWAESRPTEGGRIVVVRRSPDGQTAEVNPPPFNARTRVHEYGGGAFAVADGVLYFSNFADQRLYRVRPGEEPEAITPEGAYRFADGVVDARRRRLVCVREDHTASDQDATNSIVSVSLDNAATAASPQDIRVLEEGADFYSSPRLSPDGRRLAWLSWNHPNMPWDGTELWMADIAADGSLVERQRVAGGPEESIFQPEWSPDGTLFYISDRSGWWNFYRWRDGNEAAVCPRPAEFGVPQWVFGLSTYAFESNERLVCSYQEAGGVRLATLYVAEGRLEPLDVRFTSIGGLRAAPGRAYFVGGSPTQPTALVRLDLASRELEILQRASELTIDPGYLSIPEAIEFPTENGRTAHGFFYRPQNANVTGPSDEHPPLLVMSHGGPTSATSTALRLGIQFWTSRGIAVLDVNYGGSTGYGRDYRRRLDGAWGIVDVNDCANGARHLLERGEVDGERLAITGGSAGGYTTLAALTFRDVFKAGASYYGIGDLEALARDTHKFELRYLDRLVGPYPEQRDLYVARSPINFPERLSRPAIFLQGLEDKVVPPNQAEMMVDALRRKGVPVAYLAFEGEQHGFRRAETIKRALEAELYFYGRIFGFTPADAIEPVPIENL
jgi:dipeptidyl aminopeptidase/acylaminoacyl peptidase